MLFNTTQDEHPEFVNSQFALWREEHDPSYMKKISRLWRQKFIDKFVADDVLDLAASLSYYTALSLAPLLILLITFVSLIGNNFKAELLTEIQGLVGEQASEAIRAIAINADRAPEMRGVAGFVGIATLLFSAAAIFGQLRASLNKIFEVSKNELKAKDEQSFWMDSLGYLKEKIFSMGMVLTFVFISIISLVVSSFLSLFLKGAEGLLFQMLNLVISFLIFGFLFACIYYFIPAVNVRPKIAITSGFVTALMFSIGKSLIGLYLGQNAVASLYGAAGSFIVLLMWVYYSSVVIFISAEVAHELNREEEKSGTTAAISEKN